MAIRLAAAVLAHTLATAHTDGASPGTSFGGPEEQACLLQSRPASEKVNHVEASPRILYSLGASLHVNKHVNKRADLQACLETWASTLKRGEIQVIGAGAKDIPLKAEQSEKVIWDPAPECSDDHGKGGACKDAVALVHAFEQGVDWVVLLGTDNYVLPAHVEHVLKRMDPSAPVILGIRGCGAQDCEAGGLCGGGGQFFSRAALKAFLAPGREAFKKEYQVEAAAAGGWWDVGNCRIAWNRKVPIRDLAGLHGWRIEHPHLESGDLTFHYVRGTEMYGLMTAPVSNHTLHALRPGLSQLSAADGYYTGYSDAALAEYVKERAAYVHAENLRRALKARQNIR